MRAGTRGRRAKARTLAALLLTLVLGGCAAVPDVVAAPTATPEPESEFIGGVGDEVVLINCGMFVPIQAAADVLGAPVTEVIDQQYRPATTTPYAGVVAATMASLSIRFAGGHQCRYVLAGAEDGGPEVLVTVLPKGAAEFGLIEPDVNDGLANMLPAKLGDQAFSACRDGEWQGCRAEVLTGSTWLSISVSTPDLEPAVFEGYAAGVVESLGALKFAQPPGPARPDCGALVSPHDLSGPGALAGATGGDLLLLDDRASQTAATEVRGGLVECAWSGTDAGFSGVSLTIMPGAVGQFGYLELAELPSPIALETVDLAGEPGARWPDTGIEALAGCAADQCQVTVLADGVWLTVTTTGAAGLPGTTALATSAYARYAAAT
ncbi:hypothetical protein [Cryobacterium sp. AP23]